MSKDGIDNPEVGSLDYGHFRQLVSDEAPSDSLSPALAGLWWDAKGDWEKAHDCAQQRDDREGMRLHAYLHRKEGDLSNAAYWYRRAGVAPASGSLADEWETMAQDFLSRD